MVLIRTMEEIVMSSSTPLISSPYSLLVSMDSVSFFSPDSSEPLNFIKPGIGRLPWIPQKEGIPPANCSRILWHFCLWYGKKSFFHFCYCQYISIRIAVIIISFIDFFLSTELKACGQCKHSFKSARLLQSELRCA